MWGGIKMGSFTLFEVLLVSFGLMLVDCVALPRNEVDALTSFKNAIFEDPKLVLSNWNHLESDPCNWYGIDCSMAGDHVVKINISWASLKGLISPQLYQISTLEELVLHGNLFVGTIPKELSRLRNLKLLDLGSNQLSGPIPSEIGNLTSIQIINLQSNGLTGNLPYELGNLKNLEELRLGKNKFRGNIPASNSSNFTSNAHGLYASSAHAVGLCRFHELKVVDLSYNYLVGSIPKCLQHFPSLNFQGNCFHYKTPKQRPVDQCGGAILAKNHARVNSTRKPIAERVKHQSKNSRPTWLLVLEVATVIMVALLFIVAIVGGVQKWKRKPSIIIPWKKSSSTKDYTTIYIDAEAMNNVVEYSRQELEVACEDFSNIIGSSPDSLVYKGTMKGGPEIAVISLCIKEEHWTEYLELYFQKEVVDLARLSHENVGKLLGYCRESDPFTRMLVFEYASNGTLHEHLHYGEGCQFSWTRRMKIIIGIARGLKYLHNELDPPFTISVLNSSSIYLTEDFSPKLVDFECWKTILLRSEKNSGTISNEGASGELPNSLEQHLDIQRNVYAFGILLLEIVTGRPPHCKEKGHIVDLAKEFLESPDNASSIVDPELEHFRVEDLKVIQEVVKMCIHPSSRRTSMQELLSMLESGIDTSISADMRASSLAWAELVLSSS